MDNASQKSIGTGQSFTIATVKRSEIKPHPKNPRNISLAARKKLKDEIKNVGVMEPTIVNKNTGFVVGGHQRLSIIDELNRYNPETHKNDYTLTVSYVDLTDKEELKALVFLNNPAAQGQWDLDGLANLNIDFGVAFDEMGFDQLDVQIMFDGDPRFTSSFESNPEVKTEAQKAAEIASIKESKKAAREKWKDSDSVSFYVRVYGRDQAQLEEFLQRIGLPTWETDISVDSILEALDGIRPTTNQKASDAAKASGKNPEPQTDSTAHEPDEELKVVDSQATTKIAKGQRPSKPAGRRAAT